jgi:hypothetical protein
MAQYQSQAADTSTPADQMMIRLYQEMSPIKKLQRISELTEMVDHLALINIRLNYPQATERELLLRLAARKYPRELMVAAFSWDPELHGY